MRRARPYALLFLALTAIYHSNLRPIAAGDSLPAALIPFSVMLDHSITLDRFGSWFQDHATYGLAQRSRGHWYSIYPIAGPVLASPLYLPAVVIPALSRLPPESLIMSARIAEKFTAVTLAAASAVWMLALLSRLAPARWAWVLTWVFALGTATWSISSQAMWQHTFGAVAIVGCLYCLARWEVEQAVGRWAWCCGAAAGAALMIRPSNAILLAAVAGALWTRRAGRTDVARVFGPALAALVAVASYNLFALGRFGGVYTPDMLLAGAGLRGWAGILVSPGRGLLVYSPIALFAMAAFLPASRDNCLRHRAVLTASAVFAVGQMALIGSLPFWWGGYCWGPRLLTEIVPGLIVLIAIGIPAICGAARYAFAAVAVYCLFIQALGVYYYPKGHWDHLPVSVDRDPRRLWDWSDNPIARTLEAGPAWEPYAIVETAWKEGLPAAAKRLREFGISDY
jgi:hypothetical protein